MTTCLLHGGMLREENASNDAYFKRIADAVAEGGTLLVVLFASEEERWPESFEITKQYIQKMSRAKPIRFVQATVQGFIEEVKTADALCIRGGSTNRLLSILRSYGSLASICEGKLVAGSSAGAYALAKIGYDKSQKTMREGLGLVDVRVLCHYLSDAPTERTDDEAVAIMESTHQALPFIVLRDHEWKELTV